MSKLNIRSSMLGVVAISILAVAVSIIRCEVDYSKPDLSMFNLRPVESFQLAQKRINQPIEDLATGAKVMHDALFLNDTQVRCMSYAHLIRIVDASRMSHGNNQHKPIRQVDAEALATVVASDQLLYFGFFTKYQSDQLPPLFMETIERLERRTLLNKSALGAWNDLIKCLSAYHYHNKGVEQFLAATKARKNALESFKMHPGKLDENKPWLKLGKSHVSWLRMKFEPRVVLVDEGTLQELRWRVASFDSDEMADFRREVEQLIEQELFKPDSYTYGRSRDHNELAALTKLEDLAMDKMIGLTLTRQRILTNDEKINKLSTNEAFDFVARWNDLVEFQSELDPIRPVGKQVAEFLNDAQNKATAERFIGAVYNYSDVMLELNKLAEANKNKTFKNLNDLRDAYDRLMEKMNKVDDKLDVYDLFEKISSQKIKELAEYNIMDRFINDNL